MKKEITNKDIYDKLIDIEELLLKQRRVKKFDNIIDWKKFIWDNCPNKEQRITKKDIEFNCKILKDACEFEKCPRNWIS